MWDVFGKNNGTELICVCDESALVLHLFRFRLWWLYDAFQREQHWWSHSAPHFIEIISRKVVKVKFIRPPKINRKSSTSLVFKSLIKGNVCHTRPYTIPHSIAGHTRWCCFLCSVHEEWWRTINTLTQPVDKREQTKTKSVNFFAHIEWSRHNWFLCFSGVASAGQALPSRTWH